MTRITMDRHLPWTDRQFFTFICAITTTLWNSDDYFFQNYCCGFAKINAILMSKVLNPMPVHKRCWDIVIILTMLECLTNV